MRPMTRSATAREGGFSLSEMLVVIALIGLFVLFGGPAMADAYRAYKVRSVADYLATDVRALRYSAVAQRASRTMTVNGQGHATAPNQYTFMNAAGDTITRRIESGVNLDDSSASTVTFNTYGATGSTGSLTIQVRGDVNGTRGDRYVISVSPSGTVTTAYSTYTP
jgi:prepilin-type N-terminal cleavage/methylation domain-containing protein